MKGVRSEEQSHRNWPLGDKRCGLRTCGEVKSLTQSMYVGQVKVGFNFDLAISQRGSRFCSGR